MKRHIAFVTAAAAALTPFIALAAWQGAPGTAPESNAPGPVWLNPSSPQAGYFSVTQASKVADAFNTGSADISGAGNLGLSSDLYFTTTGKSIRVDGNGATTLRVGNYDGANNDTFSFSVVTGNPYAEVIRFIATDSTGLGQICLNGDCRTTWPSGGADANQFVRKSGDSMTGPLGLGIASSTNYWLNVDHPESGTAMRANGAGYGLYALGGAYGIYSYGNWGAAYLDGVVYAQQYCLLSGECLSGSGGGGGISSITAGNGITVSNGNGPTATISANTNLVQARVSGSCAAGSSIRVINANGSVTCETDDTGSGGGGSGDVTDVLAGTGITVSNSGGPAPTVSLGSTYQTGAAYDTRFVRKTGDTMTGTLQFNSAVPTTIDGARTIRGASGLAMNVQAVGSSLTLEGSAGGGVQVNVNGGWLTLLNGDARKPGGGNWSTFSDARLKDQVTPYQKGLEDILKLEPVTYQYKENNPLGYASDITYTGLIAQDAKNAFPESVGMDKSGYYTLDSSQIQWASINAIKELKAENDSLKAELNSLKNQLDRLESRLK